MYGKPANVKIPTNLISFESTKYMCATNYRRCFFVLIYGLDNIHFKNIVTTVLRVEMLSLENEGADVEERRGVPIHSNVASKFQLLVKKIFK